MGLHLPADCAGTDGLEWACTCGADCAGTDGLEWACTCGADCAGTDGSVMLKGVHKAWEGLQVTGDGKTDMAV